MKFELHQGDCLDVLKTLADCSVDAIVTDPPAGIAFMNREWDRDKGGKADWIQWMQSVADQCLRVIKPGGHALVWAIPRTSHWTGTAWEDAGWQPRDKIYHIFGSGFPKSADVSKRIDLEERKQWLDVSKAIDNLDVLGIMEAWKKHLKIASDAELSFARNQIETGTNTLKSGFALGRVLIQADPESSDALALLAELSSREALLTLSPEKTSALTFVDASEPQSLAKHAENSQKRETAKFTIIGIALCDAKESPSASMASRLKGVEALRIWLGSNASSRLEATNAICAALTEDLRRIILSQSKIFQSLDTTRQTDCASAIAVTITESTAESLILFTAGILKSKSIDKAAGAEREVVGSYKATGTARNSKHIGAKTHAAIGEYERDVDRIFQTAPATEAAKQWEGWGTALKPAAEEWWLFRKPPIGTIAANVLEHGTGGLNIGACRIGDEERWDPPVGELTGIGSSRTSPMGDGHSVIGRWPANFIHDGSEEVLALLGEAARFYYSPKASRDDRDEGCGAFELAEAGIKNDSGRGFSESNPMAAVMRRNSHPTVKPTDLMRYLCRLITPPGGIVLDPFTGSGSTGKAAMAEGFRFIGIEREAEYIEIARARISAEAEKPRQLSLF
jgi:hypothetical protein